MLVSLAMPLRPSLAESYRDERETYVRERLRLAFQALKCLSAQGCFPGGWRPDEDIVRAGMGYKPMWPDMQAERHKDYADKTTTVRYLATAEELAALEEIEREGLLWRIKDIRHRIAVALKALHPNAGWRRTAAMLGKEREWLRCSHETARRWERQGIEDICRMPVVGSWRDDCEGG
jgi:hypothetical protein